jgi:hypothetical protein
VLTRRQSAGVPPRPGSRRRRAGSSPSCPRPPGRPGQPGSASRSREPGRRSPRRCYHARPRPARACRRRVVAGRGNGTVRRGSSGHRRKPRPGRRPQPLTSPSASLCGFVREIPHPHEQNHPCPGTGRGRRRHSPGRAGCSPWRWADCCARLLAAIRIRLTVVTRSPRRSAGPGKERATRLKAAGRPGWPAPSPRRSASRRRCYRGRRFHG